MFNIQRPDFISQVWDLTKSGSVVLTGSPGVGKSWTIGQLIRQCKRENRRVLSLAAEDFDVSSVDELRQAIGFKTDIVSLLTSFGPVPLLIIDGLDALRGEASQRAFRDLIQNVLDRLPTCSIVVSIRTFDLQQSPELQRLFFHFPDARRFVSVTTKPFSEDDLRVAAEQVPALKSVFQTGQSDIRELLKNPFNLRLALELLDSGAGTEELSTMHSQIQLLERYWLMRVESAADGADRKALLRQVVREMVNRKSLSVREEAAYSPGFANALKGLRSAEVLRESVTDRISFSHNILFDYAVARLLLDEDEVFTFIKADSSRTIFFRPSILHFFHHLWWRDRTMFWNVSSRWFADPQLPERAKVVPAVVVTEASRSLPDLEQLFSDDAAKRGLPLTLRAIQAFGTLQTPRRQLWLTLLDKLADHVELEFINEFVSLLGIANQSKVQNEDSQLGSISRRLLLWMWRTAEQLPKHQGDQLASIAAGRVMPVVMQLYGSDTSATREIVEVVVNRFGSPAASPHDAFVLAHEIKHVIEHDPALAVVVYQRMFSHPEQSEETTVMGGGGPVVTLTSTRKQDFETALYSLQQGFAYFLKFAPRHAAEAAVLATNAEIQQERPLAEDEQTRQSFKFKLLGGSVTYVSDFSEIWDHGAREYLSLQLLNTVLQEAGSDASRAPTAVHVVAAKAQVAVCWKRLLEAAATDVHSYFPHIRGLLRIPRFLSAPEVTIAVGNVLRAAYEQSVISDSDKTQVEDAIKRIPRSRFIKRYEKPNSIQNRLLLCIGAERLISDELRSRAEELAKGQKSFANEPHVRISGGAMSFSTEDWLREQGADTAAKENADILAATKTVTEFEHKFLNTAPSIEECIAVEPQLRQLHELTQAGLADELVSEHARGVLYAAAESVLKNQDLGKKLSVSQFCRTILFQGAKDPAPVFDPKYHLPFDMPSWSSPLPRIEVARGLSHLLWNYGSDDELVQAFIRLTEDQVPAVRYQVAVGLLGFYKHNDFDRFWDLIAKMMAAETTAGVMLGLLGALGRIAGNDPERVVEQLTKVIDRGLPETGRSEMTRTLMQTLTGLYVVRGDQKAGEQLARFEAEPVLHAGEVADEVFTASHYLTPNNADGDARYRARELFQRVLSASYQYLPKTSTITEPKERADAIMAVMRHIDEVASRIYFALDIEPGLRTPERSLTEEQRRSLYFELKPIVSALAEGSPTSEHHLLPRTAHYVLQTLNGVVGYDPAAIIKLAAQVCNAASAFSYQFDAMAIREVVQLVDRSLADHKDTLKDPSVAGALGEILDIFVRAGWPDALQLTFKLDQAIR